MARANDGVHMTIPGYILVTRGPHRPHPPLGRPGAAPQAAAAAPATGQPRAQPPTTAHASWMRAPGCGPLRGAGGAGAARPAPCAAAPVLRRRRSRPSSPSCAAARCRRAGPHPPDRRQPHRRRQDHPGLAQAAAGAPRQRRAGRARRRPALSGLSDLGRHRLAERRLERQRDLRRRATRRRPAARHFRLHPDRAAPPARRSASPPIRPTRISTGSSSARSPSPGGGTFILRLGDEEHALAASTRRARAAGLPDDGQRPVRSAPPRSPPRMRARSPSPPSAPSGAAAASSCPISAWSASQLTHFGRTRRCRASAPSSPPTGPT